MSRRRANLDVYHAIADPTRRRILDLLRGGESAVKDLVDQFDMSQPAVSQHLRVLREVGLVGERKIGRQRFYSIKGQPLQEVTDWALQFQDFWQERLGALGDLLDAEGDS